MTAATQQQPGTSLVRQKVAAILLSEDAKRQIAPFIPHGTSLERVVSTVNQVVAENPELLECTPESLIMAVGKGVKWDLEFGETVHLVPFNVNVAKRDQQPRWEKRAKALRDWKGDIELVVGSGAARAVDAQCFYENEYFKYEQGTHPFIEHRPIVDPVKRGKMLGAYGWALISQRAPLKIAVMSVAEIDKIRQEKSKSWKEGPLPDWYARKTLVHQVTKAIPKNPKLAKVLHEFEQEEVEEIPEADFVVTETVPVAEQPAAAAASPPADPNAPASEAQLERLLDLISDKRVNDQTRNKVDARLKKGITAGLAATWIEAIELSLRNAAAAEEGDDLPLSKSA
jgi:phage RecT family recombinase